MSIRCARIFAIVCLIAPAASPYGRLKSPAGALFHRTDFAAVQFQLNQLALPGLGNSDGQVFITPDSDVAGAVASAMATWNSVQASAARFLPVQTTAGVNVGGDGNNVIVFLDTPAIRSVLGPSLTAVTVASYYSDGSILDSDILFNPMFSFSTTGAPNTYDIQGVLTHELGHSLGANHTTVLGAALYPFTVPNATTYRNLSDDDVAFAAAAYPAPPSAANGAIAGTLTLNGSPLRSALINAVETTNGITLTALTSAADGTYSLTAPPGNYLLFAQPLTGNILPGNLYLTTADAVDTGFSPGFLVNGGVPAPVAVAAGVTSNGNFSPPASVTTALNLQFFNTAAAGAFGDQGRLLGTALPQSVISGQTIDFVLLGPGIDSTLTDTNVLLFGPIALQPGSVRADAFVDSKSGLPYIRLTVAIAPVSAPTVSTLIIMKNDAITSFTGGLVLLPPPAAP